MCIPVSCDVCGKGTWTGCGQHIPSAMSNYSSRDQWCSCAAKDGSHSEFPPKKGDAAAN